MRRPVPLAFLGAFASALVMVGCEPEQSPGAPPLEPAGYRSEPASGSLDEAIQQARANLDAFQRAVMADSDSIVAMARVLAETEDGTHSVWIEEVRYRNGLFEGRVMWAPPESEIPEGTELTVDPADVSDWILVGPQGMAGGYTRAFTDELDRMGTNLSEEPTEGLPDGE